MLKPRQSCTVLTSCRSMLGPGTGSFNTHQDGMTKSQDAGADISHAIHLQDFQTALNAFGETMAASISHHSTPQGSYLATGFRQVQWLLATFGCYAQRVLSRTDVAVMFLSRKILVNQVGLAAVQSSLPVFYRHPSTMATAQQLPPGYFNGYPDYAAEPRSVRAVLGAMLFLAAVESAWQMHHRTMQYLPKNLQAAISPIQVAIVFFG